MSFENRKQLVADIAEDYVSQYQNVCDFLEAVDPDTFRKMFPGGKEECYKLARQKAVEQFREWLREYPRQMALYLKSAQLRPEILNELGV